MGVLRFCAQFWGVAVAALAFAAVYAGVLTELARNWLEDDNYSHGLLVIPAALYLAWNRREHLRLVPCRPSASGFGIVAAALAILLVGTAGIELFITRMSMIGVLAGAIVALLGWAFLRAVAFPLAFLVLMIPLPTLIFNEVAFPLQLLATRFGVAVLHLFDVPVFSEGNVIVLASTSLEVAEACSGIRSLVSLLTLALLYGYFVERRAGPRVLIALSVVPVAIVANGLRVAGSGFAAHHFGPEAASGVLHELSGWLVFVLSLAMVAALWRIVRPILPRVVAGAGWPERAV